MPTPNIRLTNYQSDTVLSYLTTINEDNTKIDNAFGEDRERIQANTTQIGKNAAELEILKSNDSPTGAEYERFKNFFSLTEITGTFSAGDNAIASNYSYSTGYVQNYYFLIRNAEITNNTPFFTMDRNIVETKNFSELVYCKLAYTLNDKNTYFNGVIFIRFANVVGEPKSTISVADDVIPDGAVITQLNFTLTTCYPTLQPV